MWEVMNVLFATEIPDIPNDAGRFHRRVTDGALTASGLDALLAMAALFAGYDSMTAEKGADQGTPSIWDDAMDMRFACR